MVWAILYLVLLVATLTFNYCSSVVSNDRWEGRSSARKQ